MSERRVEQPRAIVASPHGSLQYTTVTQEPPTPNEAVVRVHYGGICGSDLHYWRSGRVGESVIADSLVLGHEIVGVIEHAASDGSGPAVGTPVFVHPAIVCGRCPSCLAGRQNLCEELRYLGSAAQHPHTPGGFVDSLAVAVERLLPIDGIPLRQAALIEPASVAWHAIDRAARVAELDHARVAVVGSGPIGLLCVAVLHSRYRPAEVLATDLHAFALDRARAVGATRVECAAEADRLEQQYDVVIESSGSAAGLATALRLARPGGVVVALGQLPAQVSAPLQLLVGREIDLLGSSRFYHEATAVIEALRNGSLAVDGVVSHVLPSDRAIEAFELAADASRSSKVLIEFAADEHAAGESTAVPK